MVSVFLQIIQSQVINNCLIFYCRFAITHSCSTEALEGTVQLVAIK